MGLRLSDRLMAQKSWPKARPARAAAASIAVMPGRMRMSGSPPSASNASNRAEAMAKTPDHPRRRSPPARPRRQGQAWRARSSSTRLSLRAASAGPLPPPARHRGCIRSRPSPDPARRRPRGSPWRPTPAQPRDGDPAAHSATRAMGRRPCHGPAGSRSRAVVIATSRSARCAGRHGAAFDQPVSARRPDAASARRSLGRLRPVFITTSASLPCMWRIRSASAGCPSARSARRRPMSSAGPPRSSSRPCREMPGSPRPRPVPAGAPADA